MSGINLNDVIILFLYIYVFYLYWQKLGLVIILVRTKLGAEFWANTSSWIEKELFKKKV